MGGWRDRLKTLGNGLAQGGSRNDCIPEDIYDQLPLASIEKVTFYKRDELTTDLVCCDVEARGQVWFCHEEAEDWEALVRYLECLPNFREDWYQAVVQPPFAASETVAFARN